jgi:hypothetical protein
LWQWKVPPARKLSMSSFHFSESVCSGDPGRKAQLSQGSLREAHGSVGSQNQGAVDRLPGRPAICANHDLAAIELDAVIGMDVHPGALAGRAAIGGAGDCLGGFGRAARATVWRAPVSKLTGTRHPPVGRNGPGTGFANSGLKIANRELAQIRKLGKNPKRFRCLAGERAGDRTQDPVIKSLN